MDFLGTLDTLCCEPTVFLLESICVLFGQSVDVTDETTLAMTDVFDEFNHFKAITLTLGLLVVVVHEVEQALTAAFFANLLI